MGERMDGGALRDFQKTAARETTLFPDPDLFCFAQEIKRF